MSNKSCSDQSSINFLNNNSFQFNLLNAPKLNFFCNRANLPEISIPTASQSTLYNNISYPGDQITYGDLIVTFKVSEDLSNYLHLYNWITTSGYPIDLTSLYQYQKDVVESANKYAGEYNNGGIFSDATLTILDNNLNKKFVVKYNNCFPTRLGELDFSTDNQTQNNITCTCSFKYTFFTINPF